MSVNALDLLKQPTRERLADQIAKQIKKLIFSKKLEIGQKLPTERELAETLHVSRVVVREALRSLDQSGFIETRPGHTGGSFVSNKVYKPLFDSIYDLFQQGKVDLQHFYQAREAIERFSAQLAMKYIEERDIRTLCEINQKLKNSIFNTDTFHQNNMAFHMQIAELSRNPLIKLLVAGLLNLLKIFLPESCQSPNFIRNTYDRHLLILEAMKQKDTELVQSLIAKDTSYTIKLTIEEPEW
jgi:GntR family transcriptional regulator, transcriptional repressor for pyruvate dehydrogenase complex